MRPQGLPIIPVNWLLTENVLAGLDGGHCGLKVRGTPGDHIDNVYRVAVD
jgi:hypothetical protein